VRLLEVGIFDKTLGKQTSEAAEEWASLKKAAKQKNIPGQFEEVQEGSLVTGFVRNITSTDCTLTTIVCAFVSP
jgi:hypothetical protein